MLFALLPSWAQRARRGRAPRARIAKIPPVTRLRRMAAPSFELRPQQLRASDFGVELPSPEQIFDGAEGRRQHILLETLAALEKASAAARYHELALRNLQRWAQQARPSPTAATAAAAACAVLVLPGDWGEVTLELTRRYGTLFASLNMANAYGPVRHPNPNPNPNPSASASASPSPNPNAYGPVRPRLVLVIC